MISVAVRGVCPAGAFSVKRRLMASIGKSVVATCNRMV